ncbi:hypothetical protein MSHRCOH1_08600 [Candidatus Ornithobacterium hominis]|nr:hypothetical protein MSHRCOH1_08600 [Candidatus Ornithobacterium hominis]
MHVKRCIIILSLFILFKPILPWIEYAIFYDYIKNELCINKEEKNSNCHGTCHLNKQLAKATDAEGDEKPQFSSNQKEIVICQMTAHHPIKNMMKLQQLVEANFSYQETYFYDFNSTLFRPPIV